MIFRVCQIPVLPWSVGEEKGKALPHRFVNLIVLQRRSHHEQNLQSDLEQSEKLLRGGE